MAGNFEEIQQRFMQMLEDGRHIFDAAANALVGGTDPSVIRADLFATDKRINETEQELRRQIVVHGSVHGPASFPALLVLMSLAKDAERIGDYAKNIFDLSVVETELGDDAAALTELKDQISKLLVKGRNLYQTEDEEGAREFLLEADRVEDACDAAVTRLLAARGENMAGRALAYRYFKRVTSHIANVVTALVVPLDKLDFFDED
jgi:phosphate uptake regulator